MSDDRTHLPIGIKTATLMTRMGMIIIARPRSIFVFRSRCMEITMDILKRFVDLLQGRAGRSTEDGWSVSCQRGSAPAGVRAPEYIFFLFADVLRCPLDLLTRAPACTERLESPSLEFNQSMQSLKLNNMVQRSGRRSDRRVAITDSENTCLKSRAMPSFSRRPVMSLPLSSAVS